MSYDALGSPYQHEPERLLNEASQLLIVAHPDHPALAELLQALSGLQHELHTLTPTQLLAIPDEISRDALVVVMTQPDISHTTIQQLISHGFDLFWLDVGSESSTAIETLNTASVRFVANIPFSSTVLHNNVHREQHRQDT